MNPGDILSNYASQGHHLSALVQPYALHLLYLLGIVEICTIGLTYAMDEDGLSMAFGKGIRFILLFGFSYWWIENAWTLATTILGSFNQLGSNITGVPDLTPVGFIKTATRIAHTLWNAPSSAHYLPDIGMAIGEIVLAALIFVVMLLIAGIVIFTLASAWLIIGPGSILVPLMVNRFTSHIAEGYFTWIIRTGVLILFFYVILGTAGSFASDWNASLISQCNPGADNVCTTPIPIDSLLTLLGSTVVLAFICIGVPFTAAHIVTGGVNMALEHLASAKYLGGSIARSINRSNQNQQGSQYLSQNGGPSQSTLQQRMYAGSQATQRVPPSQAPTQIMANRQVTQRTIP